MRLRKYRLFITFFFSFTLHVLLLAYFITNHQKELKFKQGVGEQKIKASFLTLSDLPIPSSKAPATPPHPKTQPTSKPTPKPKKQIKQSTKKTKTQDLPKQKEVFKEPPKEKPSNIIQETIPEQITPQESQPKEATPEEISQLEQTLQAPLEDFIPQSQQSIPQQTPITPIEKSIAYQLADPYTKKNISEIYGEDFGQLGKEEQEFIINNLSIIGRITQSELKYPADAGMLKQSGTNVVEFYLHPDGSISDLKVITPSGFFLLDRNSILTIKKAYRRYPYPKTKTLIRFYISYILRN